MDAEKRIRRGKTDPLIAVEENLTVRQRLHEGCGFLELVVVVAVLGSKDGGLKQAYVAKPMNAAELFDDSLPFSIKPMSAHLKSTLWRQQ